MESLMNIMHMEEIIEALKLKRLKQEPEDRENLVKQGPEDHKSLCSNENRILSDTTNKKPRKRKQVP